MLCKIAVASYFRDSQQWHGNDIDHVGKFFRNWEEQADEAGVELEFFLLEGDSRDDTGDVLRREAAHRAGKVHLQFFNTGSRDVASDGGEDRRLVLSHLGNRTLKPAVDSGTGLLLWSESDLVPTRGLLKGLTEATGMFDWERSLLVSPLPIIYIEGYPNFYDGWAFEGANGERWDQSGVWDTKVWQEEFQKFPRYRRMNSIGSCALLNARLMRQHGIDFGDGCFPGMCEKGRRCGLNILCDTTLHIVHPSQDYTQERWI